MAAHDFIPVLLTELPFDLPGRVFRSPMPYSRMDPWGEIYPEYQAASVSVVVLLVSDEESLAETGRNLRQHYQQHGMQVIHLPILDFSVPELAELQAAVFAAEAQLRQGRNLAVHCYAGIGRTGLFLACLARQVMGLSAPEAMDWVRCYIRGAVEVEAQKRLVEKFTGRSG